MLKRAYVEITNICNLRCNFCPGTRRPGRFMPPEEFRLLAERLRGRAAYLYLHVMGEPLLHPQLREILDVASELGFRVCVTTNGTLLPEKGETLLSAASLHKVSVSLHSAEGNGTAELEDYLRAVWDFAVRLTAIGGICALRLWNIGGAQERNEEILSFLAERTGVWPLAQAAVLCDGTVVPCCLDHEGDIPLGNLLEQSLEEILDSPRARALVRGFSDGKPSEALARRSGFATRFG